MAALLCALLLPSRSAAANGEQTPLDLGGETANKAAEAGTGGSLVRTIVGLAIVIAVIYGLTWVLRQVKASREAGDAGAGLQTLATLALGPGRSLHLVRAGDEVVLVGSGEHGVTPIRSYTEAEARALGLLEQPGTGLETLAGDTDGPFATGGRGRGFLAELRRRTVIR
ncbi:MAG TPA: flagellar biosynthetic protein FliO [Solirubrobacteraceae bacterium]|nr:flagellar biosynthetic protein FliO [Solirubrobacteraceae bacterium]